MVAYGFATTSQTAAVAAIKALPINQQMVLCAAARTMGLFAEYQQQKQQKSAAAEEEAKEGTVLGDLTVSAAARKPGSAQPARAAARAGPLVRKDCRLGELQDAYIALCKRQGMTYLGPLEFSATACTLEGLGLLGEMSNASPASLYHVAARTAKRRLGSDRLFIPRCMLLLQVLAA